MGKVSGHRRWHLPASPLWEPAWLATGALPQLCIQLVAGGSVVSEWLRLARPSGTPSLLGRHTNPLGHAGRWVPGGSG